MIKEPSDITLRKYGLSLEEWRGLLHAQSGVCPVCGREPPSGRMTTDHEHVKGWRKLPPGQRKIFVRGLLCWTCNHYALARGMSIERAENVAAYLRRYEARKSEAIAGGQLGASQKYKKAVAPTRGADATVPALPANLARSGLAENRPGEAA